MKDLLEWSEKQLQKPEVLQNMLLQEQDKNNTIIERCKSLSNMLDNVGQYKPLPTPLRPIIELPMNQKNQKVFFEKEYTLLTYYKKNLFSTVSAELIVNFISNQSTVYKIVYKKTGLFKQHICRTTTSHELAVKLFSKLANKGIL